MIFSVDVISIIAVCAMITFIGFFKLVIYWLDYLAEESSKKDIEKLKGENNG